MPPKSTPSSKPKLKNKKRRSRPRRSKKLNALMPTHGSDLAICEQVYIRALADPFDPLVQGRVCYPSFPAKKSVKHVNTQTVNVTIGTAGIGWLMYDVTPSNDSDAIWYTDATYAGTTLSSTTKTTGAGVSSARWTTPNDGGSFLESTNGTGNVFRIVVAGAKFRYIGTELNRGGSVFALAAPQQDSMVGFVLGNCAIPTISREHPVTTDYQTVVLPPMHDEDVQWKDADQNFPWSDGGSTTSNPLMLLVFVGTPGNTFVIRLVEHVEVAGTFFNAYGSMSHIGNPMVVQSATAAAASAVYSAPTQGKSYLSQFASVLSDIADQPIVKSAARFAGRLAISAIGARFGMGGAVAGQLALDAPRRRAIDVD